MIASVKNSYWAIPQTITGSALEGAVYGILVGAAFAALSTARIALRESFYGEIESGYDNQDLMIACTTVMGGVIRVLGDEELPEQISRLGKKLLYGGQ